MHCWTNFNWQNQINSSKNTCYICELRSNTSEVCGIYQHLVDFAGAGATVPLTGFGNLLAKGAIQKVQEVGLVGAFTGGTAAAAGGIAAAVFFGYIASLVSKPKMKKQ